jgi:hypothetical protein
LKVRAFPDWPLVQVGELTSVAVLPFPEASAEVAPIPSSRCQRPAIPWLQEAQVVTPQALPQLPQLFWFEVVSTQVPLQSVPVAQPQLLEMQLSPPPVLQVVPQEPQLPGSTALLVQAPPQMVSPPAQPPQVDALQVWRAK